jgi:Big-like domain-containing protein
VRRTLPERRRRPLALFALLVLVMAAVGGAAVASTYTSSARGLKVTVLAPQAKALKKGRVVLRAKATSPAGIRRVEFRINGKLVAIDRKPPYVLTGKAATLAALAKKAGARRSTGVVTVKAVDKRGTAVTVRRPVRWHPRSGSGGSGGSGGGGTTTAPKPKPGSGGGRPGTTTSTPTTPRPPTTSTPSGPPVTGAPRPRPAPPLPAASLYVAAGGAANAPCTPAAPCSSLDRAYHLASPGQVIEVAGGNYPGQGVGADPSKANGPDVYFRPAAGQIARFGEISTNGATHIEFRDLTASFSVISSDHITLRNIDPTGIDGNTVYITSSSDVAVIGGDWGPTDPDDISQVKPASASSPVPTNITFDGVYFHDATRRSDPSAHTDCLQFGGARNVTIANSTFVRCETESVFVRSWFGNASLSSNFVVENNFFGATNVGYYTLIFADANGMTNALVRYNSFAQAPRTDAANNIRFVANVGPLSDYACVRGVDYEYNVWSDAKCSSTDIQAPSGFVDASKAANDLHLRAGAAAIGKGSPSEAPAADIDGQPRPQPPSRADAGADQR